MRMPLAVPVLTLAVSLIVAGCGTAAEPTVAQDVPSAAASVAPAPSSGAAPAVPATLRFSARTLDGKTFDAASVAGRPVALWFWAPWCPTCRAQAAGVAAAAQQSTGATVIGVAGLDDEAAMRRFVADRGLEGLPHLSDEAGEVWKRFEVREQSTFVLLDSAGQVAFQGYLDGDEVAERVRRLS